MAGFFQTPEQPGYRALADYFQNSKVANPAGNPIGRAAATGQPRLGGGGLPAPSDYMPENLPSRSPQQNPLSFLNAQPGRADALPGVAGPSRTPGPALPSPDYIAGNPSYGQDTAMMSRGYAPLGDGVYSQSNAVRPGTVGDGSQIAYNRNYTSQSGTANGVSRFAPGLGTLHVMDQGNGGTVEGNVAAINRQIAALQDLQQAQLDDPYNGRFRFGTDGIRRGVDPLDVASGRTDALGTLLPDVSRRGPRSQLRLADLMQQANIASLQDARTGQQQQLQGQANANSALSDLFRQQQQGQQFAANYGLNALKFQNDVLRNNRLDQSLIDSRNSQTAKDQRLTPDQMVANWMDIYTNSPDQQQRQNALNYLTQYYQLKSPQAGAL
jgi:hypothetical protein